MQRLSRTQIDTIWTQMPSNPKGGTPRCDMKKLSKLYRSPNQHMIEEESNQQMIDSKTHQHMEWDINRNRIKQHMRDKTQIEK